MFSLKVSFSLVFVATLALSCGKRIRLSRPIIGNEFAARIIDGKNSTWGQFPYSAQLVSAVPQESPSGPLRFFDQYCGGSVISEQHILTAAHCVDGAIQVKVKLGHYNDAVIGGQKIYAGEYVNVHPGFNRTSRENDIALVELYNSITFSSIIKPVQLSCSYIQPNTRVQVAGSGLTFDAETDIPPALEYADLTTISNQQCSTYLPYIVSSKICSQGTDNQGTCHGDSGAAMIEMVNGTPLQVALVSAGAGMSASCERGLPDSYTRISSFLSWIRKLVPVTCHLNV